MVQVVAADGKPPLAIWLFQYDEGREVFRQFMSKTVMLNEQIEIEMDWTTPKKVTIKIGGETRKFNVQWPIDSLAISGSTGEFKIDPLEIKDVSREAP